jgi:anoctamin-10
VEKLRPQFLAESAVASGGSFPWWKRELRAVLSLPVFAVFALVLILILTFNFIFEAFFTQIYTGPGHRFVSFSPTILFIALVPRLLTLYQTSAVRMTNWENHAHRSSYDYSLTVKTFALSALVAYSGLALSAFVYVPFHEQIMTTVHRTLFTSTFTSLNKGGLFEENILQARAKVNPRRLQDQMYAFTVRCLQRTTTFH